MVTDMNVSSRYYIEGYFFIAFLDELGHSEHFIKKRWNLGPDPPPLMENSIFFFFEPFP
jgi:hypothetical protein